MQTHGALLAGGGLLDQPRALFITAKACVRVYEALREYNSLPLDKGIDWQKANPDKAALVDWYELSTTETDNG